MPTAPHSPPAETQGQSPPPTSPLCRQGGIRPADRHLQNTGTKLAPASPCVAVVTGRHPADTRHGCRACNKTRPPFLNRQTNKRAPYGGSYVLCVTMCRCACAGLVLRRTPHQRPRKKSAVWAVLDVSLRLRLSTGRIYDRSIAAVLAKRPKRPIPRFFSWGADVACDGEQAQHMHTDTW